MSASDEASTIEIRKIALLLHVYGKCYAKPGVKSSCAYYSSNDGCASAPDALSDGGGTASLLDLPIELWHARDVGILYYLNEYDLAMLMMSGTRMLQFIWPMMKVVGSIGVGNKKYNVYYPEQRREVKIMPLIWSKGMILQRGKHKWWEKGAKIVFTGSKPSYEGSKINEMIVEWTTNKVWANPTIGCARLSGKTALSNIGMHISLYGKKYTHYTSLKSGGTQLLKAPKKTKKVIASNTFSAKRQRERKRAMDAHVDHVSRYSPYRLLLDPYFYRWKGLFFCRERKEDEQRKDPRNHNVGRWLEEQKGGLWMYIPS